MLNKYNAILIMMGLLTCVIIFHLLVITGIIPYTIVWAGKLKSTSDMYVFESISIAINLLLIGVLIIKRRHIKQNISNKILNAVLWFFVIIFALNTLGNLTSKTLLEKALFTPLTFISAILLWIIVKQEKPTSH
jgi:hypothetical protein